MNGHAIPCTMHERLALVLCSFELRFRYIFFFCFLLFLKTDKEMCNVRYVWIWEDTAGEWSCQVMQRRRRTRQEIVRHRLASGRQFIRFLFSNNIFVLLMLLFILFRPYFFFLQPNTAIQMNVFNCWSVKPMAGCWTFNENFCKEFSQK